MEKEKYSGLEVAKIATEGIPQWQYNKLKGLFKENGSLTFEDAKKEMPKLTKENFNEAKKKFK